MITKSTAATDDGIGLGGPAYGKDAGLRAFCALLWIWASVSSTVDRHLFVQVQ